jgi:hypothetical protein
MALWGKMSLMVLGAQKMSEMYKISFCKYVVVGCAVKTKVVGDYL